MVLLYIIYNANVWLVVKEFGAGIIKRRIVFIAFQNDIISLSI